MDWHNRIKQLLKNIILYQIGQYSPSLLEKQLDRFLRDAEKQLCESLRINGALCWRSYYEEEGDEEEASRLALSDAYNWEMINKNIARAIKLSLKFKDIDTMDLTDKILLFDEIIHTEHVGGNIFGVDIDRLKQEVENEIKNRA